MTVVPPGGRGGGDALGYEGAVMVVLVTGKEQNESLVSRG